MDFLFEIFGRPEHPTPPAPPATSETYFKLYGKKLKAQVAFLRSKGRYLPEMDNPHWNRRER